MKKVLSILLAAIILLPLSGCRKSDVSYDTEVPDVTVSDTSITAAETTQEPEDTSLSLIMVGDVLLHEKVSDSGIMADGSYNYDNLFANVKAEIQEADIAIVNQEVILGGKELGLSGYPAFNGAFEVGDAITNAGFDIVLHATNHALDKGKTGLLNCLDFWKNSHSDIAVLGIYGSREERDNIYTCNYNGITVSILNYTYGTNGIPVPSDMPYCVNLLNENTIKADVEKAKSVSDFVIVCPHWGTEYVLEPDKNQEYWTNLFMSCGVDLVIGTHPHVIEPVTMLESNGHKMLVYYSLGNFINSTAETGKGIANRMVGAMAQITLDKGSDGKVYISSYGVDPLVTHVKTGTGNMTTYRLADYADALASQNEIVASDSSFSLKYCKDLCRQVFGDLYKD